MLYGLVRLSVNLLLNNQYAMHVHTRHTNNRDTDLLPFAQPALILTLLVLFIVLICLPRASCAESIQLNLVTEEIPPMQIQLEGQPHGYVVDFVRELIKEAASEVPVSQGTIDFMPWKRAMAKARTEPNILFFSLSRIPLREKMFHWIGEVAPYEVVLYRHITGPDTSPETITQLKDFRIGSQSGGSFEQYFARQGFNLSKVSYNRQTIQMLRLGRIDFAPQVSGSFFYRLEAMNEAPEDYIPVIRVNDLSKDLWLVASKTTDLRIVNALRNAYQRLKSDGLADRLYDAYHPESVIMQRYRAERRQIH